MNSIILTIEFILLITSLPISAKFFINTQPRNFGDTQKCPPDSNWLIWIAKSTGSSLPNWHSTHLDQEKQLGSIPDKHSKAPARTMDTSHSQRQMWIPPKDMKSFCLPIFGQECHQILILSLNYQVFVKKILKRLNISYIDCVMYECTRCAINSSCYAYKIKSELLISTHFSNELLVLFAIYFDFIVGIHWNEDASKCETIDTSSEIPQIVQAP